MDRESQSIELEKRHVHSVYNKIAPHFSDTRYKAWPRVKEFLLDLEPGCLVADVGCGNGKYLGINRQIYKIGCDCCVQLVDIARDRKHEVMVCDNIRLPYRTDSFDAVISIAVIHHFATTERRAHALRELARICRPGGQVMIYVWAMEQKQRKFDSQDVLVPWHLQPRYRKNKVRCSFEQDLLSSGSTSDEDIKKTSSINGVSSHAKSSNLHALPKGRNISSTALPRSIPTSNHISHSADCPRGREKDHRTGSIYRIQSDSLCDEILSVESSHFKRLLLPTRSDSSDDVFMNIGMDNMMDCSTYNCGTRDSYTRTRAMHTEMHGRYSPQTSPKIRNRNGKLQHPISMATSFLFDSKIFQGTKENISSAIVSKVSGSEEKSSLWDLLFGSQKTKQDEVEEVQTNGVRNSIGSKDSYISNSAAKNLPLSRVGRTERRGTFTKTQSLDCDSAVCVIQNTQGKNLTNGQLAYAARHSPLIGANQPIVGLNPMTAQGQQYCKPQSIEKSPLARNSEDTSSIQSLSASSSSECLSDSPADSQSKGVDSIKPAEIEGSKPFSKHKSKSRNNHETDKCVMFKSSRSSRINNASANKEIVDNSSIELSKMTVKKDLNTSGNIALKDTKPKENKANNDRKESLVSQISEDPSKHNLRYYHVFREGELVDLIEKHVNNLHIIRTYYDHANWCVIAEKVEVWRI